MLDFFYFQENRIPKSLRIFSSFMTVGPEVWYQIAVVLATAVWNVRSRGYTLAQAVPRTPSTLPHLDSSHLFLIIIWGVAIAMGSDLTRPIILIQT